LQPVPRLAGASRLQTAPQEERRFAAAGLQRQVNYVANALHEAWRLVRPFA